MSRAAAFIQDLFAGYEGEPGVAVAVLEGDEVAWQGGFGLASLEHRVAITPQTRFRIASISKQLCAAVMVMLEHEGRLSLDGEARAHLPELHPFEPPITVRQLLNMTAGLREELDLLALVVGDHRTGPASRGDLRDLVLRQTTQNFLTGSWFLYSNSCYALAEEIAERITGKPLGELLSERIFRPLGMASSSFESRPDVVLPDLATGYARNDDAFVRGVWGREGTAAGGVISTLEDMVRWQLNLRSNRLDPPELVARLLEVPALRNGRPSCYGLGLYVQPYRGLATVGHAGGLPGWGCDQVWFPDQDLAVIALGNRDDLSWMRRSRAVAELLLEPALAEAAGRGVRLAWGRPQQLTEDEVERFSGVFGNPDLGRVRVVGTREGRLALDRSMMERAGPTRFEVLVSDGLPQDVELVLDGDTLAAAIRVTTVGHGTETFVRCLPQQVAPPELEPYVGRYASPDLPGWLAVGGDDGRMLLHGSQWPHSPRLHLRAVLPDLFLAVDSPDAVDNGWSVHFRRGLGGEVGGLEVTTGRTWKYPMARVGP